MARGKRKAAGSPEASAPAASGNEIEARAMARMVGRAEGFALGIAVANAPSLRRRMVEEIRRLCARGNISELDLDRPISSLLSVIEAKFGFGPQLDALFVYGLEYSISGGERYVPLFGNLNLTRNLFPQKCPYPIVLWLPQYAVARLSQYAPDFFSWRSGTYTFSLQAEDLGIYIAGQLKDRERFGNLTMVEKEDRIVALEEILGRLRDLPDDPRVLDERASVLDGLGGLQLFLGRYERAVACYREALIVSKTSGNRRQEASTLHQLGIIATDRGDLAEAERLYRESLMIRRDLADRAGEAASMHNLGIVAQQRGDLAEAERLLREALAIEQALGNRRREAAGLNQLARIAQQRGDLAEAERLLRESLATEKSLGDRAGEAATLHQLGMIAEEQRNFSEAERLYRESLAIEQALGNRAREATTLHNLGTIAEQRGDVAEAERLYRESLAIAEKIGSKDAEIPRRSLERIGSQRGTSGD